jgi:hypothetical protein
MRQAGYLAAAGIYRWKILSGSLTIIERQTHCSCFIKKAICWKNDAR